jgi:hypothetical protein
MRKSPNYPSFIVFLFLVVSFCVNTAARAHSLVDYIPSMPLWYGVLEEEASKKHGDKNSIISANPNSCLLNTGAETAAISKKLINNVSSQGQGPTDPLTKNKETVSAIGEVIEDFRASYSLLFKTDVFESRNIKRIPEATKRSIIWGARLYPEKPEVSIQKHPAIHS